MTLTKMAEEEQWEDVVEGNLHLKQTEKLHAGMKCPLFRSHVEPKKEKEWARELKEDSDQSFANKWN